ncbi:MAG TPA: undecaprenyl-diphosphate phosphatase [Steroidobacteraceae bacterium]|nr:undecaprenyl-diphosphate phosphatase [Steroidobacteraceae bacterium]
MTLLKVIVLAIVQGLAELLPVSSSAHVVVAEKLMGLDPSAPPMTLLLVMLHTGTMVAVILYFWREWRTIYFQSSAAFRSFVWLIVVATVLTALVGEGLIKVIEHTLLRGVPHAQIEDLFSHLEFIAPALAAAGILIIVAGLYERRRGAARPAELNVQRAGIIGAVQGLCLPFRGFSRSGATISTGMLLGVRKARAEAFSFALAVVLTPPVVAREVLRLMQDVHAGDSGELRSVALMTLFGAGVALLAGLIALRWLSRWLEAGRWYLFGIYCLVAAAVVTLLHRGGY